MNVTLDGFMAGPHADLGWHFQHWGEDMATSLCEELSRADTIILGRVTYQVMANYWQTHSNCLTFPREDIAFAEMMNRYKKIVFSKTIHRISWNNSTLVRGDMKDEISRLKQSPGKDMIIYGSGKLVNSLMHSRLVDEFVLWVHPVLLGKGKPFFCEVNGQVNMELIDRKTFCSGVVALKYRVKMQEAEKISNLNPDSYRDKSQINSKNQEPKTKNQIRNKKQETKNK